MNAKDPLEWSSLDDTPFLEDGVTIRKVTRDSAGNILRADVICLRKEDIPVLMKVVSVLDDRSPMAWLNAKPGSHFPTPPSDESFDLIKYAHGGDQQAAIDTWQKLFRTWLVERIAAAPRENCASSLACSRCLNATCACDASARAHQAAFGTPAKFIGFDPALSEDQTVVFPSDLSLWAEFHRECSKKLADVGEKAILSPPPSFEPGAEQPIPDVVVNVEGDAS